MKTIITILLASNLSLSAAELSENSLRLGIDNLKEISERPSYSQEYIRDLSNAFEEIKADLGKKSPTMVERFEICKYLTIFPGIGLEILSDENIDLISKDINVLLYNPERWALQEITKRKKTFENSLKKLRSLYKEELKSNHRIFLSESFDWGDLRTAAEKILEQKWDTFKKRDIPLLQELRMCFKRDLNDKKLKQYRVAMDYNLFFANQSFKINLQNISPEQNSPEITNFLEQLRKKESEWHSRVQQQLPENQKSDPKVLKNRLKEITKKLKNEANAQIEVIKKLETKILHETIFIQKIDDILKKLDQ